MNRHPIKLAAGIFLVAILLRLLFVFVAAPALHIKVGPANSGYYSTDGYQALAKQLLHGHGYRFAEHAPLSVFRAPLYPAVLALFYKLTNESEVAVLLLNIIFGSVGCALCAVAAYYAFGSRVAMLAGIGVAAYPQFLLYTWSICSETFQLFFVSLFVLCLVLFFERRNLLMGAITGFSLALAVYSKGFLIGFPIVLIPALLLTRDKTGSRGRGSIILMLLVTIAAIAPWTVRNYLVTHQFIPMNTGNGYAFLIGNEYVAAGAKGVDGTNAGYAVYDHYAVDRGLSTRTATPDGPYCDLGPEADRLYNGMAKQDVLKHPGFFVKKTLIGIPRVWYITSSRGKTLAAAIMTIPMLLLSVAGTPAILRRRPNYLPYCLLLIYTTISFAMVQAHYRYSLPVSGVLITIASAALIALFGRSFDSHAANCSDMKGRFSV